MGRVRRQHIGRGSSQHVVRRFRAGFDDAQKRHAIGVRFRNFVEPRTLTVEFRKRYFMPPNNEAQSVEVTDSHSVARVKNSM
jgi:hypothetical protein